VTSFAYLRKELEFIRFTLAWAADELLGWIADTVAGIPAPGQWE
jgi:hypothetical protein